MKERELFDPCECTGHATTAIPPSAPGSETSKAAAERIAPHLSRMRHRVLWCWAKVQVGDATREEIANRWSIPLQTVCGRARELVNIGALEPSGVKRRTKQGCWAEALCITQAGAAMLAQSGE